VTGEICWGVTDIFDYGIKQSDGTWKLASDPGTTYATKADIAGSQSVGRIHIAEALSYRRQAPRN
jgi:predicted ATPase with chaperone activity